MTVGPPLSPSERGTTPFVPSLSKHERTEAASLCGQYRRYSKVSFRRNDGGDGRVLHCDMCAGITAPSVAVQ